MQDKKFEDALDAQQAMDSAGSVNAEHGSPEEGLRECVVSNPAIKRVWDNLEQTAFALSPLFEVLAVFATEPKAKRRYQEEGIVVGFEDAVHIAIVFMAARLPYTGETRPPDADLSYIYDYEIVAVNALDKNHLPELIEESEESPLAYKALQSAVGSLRRDGEPLPAELLEWSLDVAEGKRELPSVGPGRSPYSNQVRDELIVRTVQALVGCGLKATRNQATEPAESACDAVAEALKAYNIDLVYESVARIWTKGKPKDVDCHRKEQVIDTP